MDGKESNVPAPEKKAKCARARTHKKEKRNKQKKAKAKARMRWKKQPEKMYGIRSYVTQLSSTLQTNID